MVCCISFSINKKMLIPLFGGICSFIIKYLISQLSQPDKNKKDNKDNLINHPIIFCICSSLGVSLSFIPYLITIKRVKTKKQKNIEKLLSSLLKYEKTKSLIINNNYEGNTCDKFKYLFLRAFIDFFQTSLGFLVYNSIDLNLWILDIFFICFLLFFIFGTKLYKHQKLSLIIIVTLGLSLDLYINTFFRKGDINFFIFFIRVISEILYSVSTILDKFLIEKKFSSPYEICFFIGIFTLIFYSICIIISSNVCSESRSEIYKFKYNGKYYFDHFLDYIEKINIKEIILFISIMLLQFFCNLSILLTIRYFSPAHVMIILVIGKTAPSINNLIAHENKKKDIISLLIFLIIFFFLLVFNEIIELNCFKLEKNTVKNIKKRADSESQQEMDNKSEDDSSYFYDNNDLEDLNMNENEEIEGKNLENNEPNPLTYASSL